MLKQYNEILTIEKVAANLKAGRRMVYRLAANGQIFGYTDVPRSLAELMPHFHHSRHPHVVATHLELLLTDSELRPPLSDKPRLSQHHDVLTETSIQLKLLHEHAVAKPDDENGY